MKTTEKGRGRRRFYWSYWYLLLIPVIVACGHYAWMSYLKKPKLNPHPKVFFTLTGHISPKFKGKMYLNFRQTYVSTALKCYYVPNRLAGGSVSLGAVSYFPVKLDNKGQYQVKIPLDKYLPGYCNWKPFGLSSAMVRNPKNPKVSFPWSGMVSFGNDSQLANPNRMDLIYNSKTGHYAEKLFSKEHKELSSLLYIKTNQAYHLTLNFLWK